MSAGIFFAANPSVYAPAYESIARSGRKQEVIQPHTFVQGPSIAFIIPEGPKRAFGLHFPQSVGPTLRQQPGIRLATLRLH